MKCNWKNCQYDGPEIGGQRVSGIFFCWDHIPNAMREEVLQGLAGLRSGESPGAVEISQLPQRLLNRFSRLMIDAPVGFPSKADIEGRAHDFTIDGAKVSFSTERHPVGRVPLQRWEVDVEELTATKLGEELRETESIGDNMKNNPRKILFEYFEKDGNPYGVTDDKLCNRGLTELGTTSDGRTILGLERHRAILGARYFKGCAMPALQYYYMRWAVNPETGEVETLDDEPFKIEVDCEAIAAEYADECRLTVEIQSDGKIETSALSGGVEYTADTEEDAFRMLETEVIDPQVHYFSDRLCIAVNSTNWDSKELQEAGNYIEEFANCLRNLLVQELKKSLESAGP